MNRDGTLNTTRLNACLDERNWEPFQVQSKTAVEELPFGANWLDRLKGRLAGDPVYARARQFFAAQPVWSVEQGYGAATAGAYSAHYHVKAHARTYDNGYRMPPGSYWGKFRQAFYVVEAEHTELSRIANDSAALAALIKTRAFKVTPEVREAYKKMIAQASMDNKHKKHVLQREELEIIAHHEQINVLQLLIYNDPKLRETMAVAYQFSRLTAGWISPEFKVVYSAAPKTSDPTLQTTFDAPTGVMDRLAGNRKNLTNPKDRMKFVEKLGEKFNKLMSEKRPYMDGELRKIQGWLNA